MKKLTKMLAFASLASLAILSGCSDASEPDPTKAELCANGINRECLLGTWNFNGVQSKEQKAFVTDFDLSANPGSIEFYQYVEKKGNGTKEKTDMFKLSLSSADENYSFTDCNPIYGSFVVEGSDLKLSFTQGNLCIGKKNMTFTPTLTNNGATITMDMGRVWLMRNQVTKTMGVNETYVDTYYTEVFSIGAAQKK